MLLCWIPCHSVRGVQAFTLFSQKRQNSIAIANNRRFSSSVSLNDQGHRTHSQRSLLLSKYQENNLVSIRINETYSRLFVITPDSTVSVHTWRWQPDRFICRSTIGRLMTKMYIQMSMNHERVVFPAGTWARVLYQNNWRKRCSRVRRLKMRYMYHVSSLWKFACWFKIN
jgi:hypothetical protein